MKKIKLNETDLMKIVKRVLNEQEIRRFNEDEIEFLNFIFERELKPPFRSDEDADSDFWYYNRDGELIGWLDSKKDFTIIHEPFWVEIRYKVCQVFEFSSNSNYWYTIGPHLKSWLESQLNIEIRYIEL